MSGFIRTFRFPTFVLLFATFVVDSGAYEANVGSLSYSSSASANAYSSPGTASALFGNEGHKGIRSYDTSGGHNQPNGGGGQSNGHQDGGCKWSKCKWENDDYWEKDEEETEPEEEDEDECYGGDDGQYKVHDHRQKSKGGSPPGVQKLAAPNPFNGQQPYTGSGVPPFGTPINDYSQATGAHGSRQPSNQQPGSNQRYDGSTPGTGSHPPSWNSAPGSWSNADVSTDKNRPKTGFGCAGNYRETGCAQDSSGASPVKQALSPFPGIENIRKENSPGYLGSPAPGCSGSPYEKCVDKSGSQPTRPRDSDKPSYGSDIGQGRYPGSQQNVPYGPQYSASKPSESNTGPYSRPSQNAANPHVGTGLDSGAGRTPIFGSTDSSPIGSPFGTAQTSNNAPPVTQKPGYNSAKGGPSGTNAGSRTNASKDGDSKIFYINVTPSSGKPEGYKPSNAQPSYRPNYSATGTTKLSYQPTSHGDTQTTKSYQPAFYDGKTQPSHQPGSDFGTTKPSYQPGVYDATTKPSYQPNPYDNAQTTKSYQPVSYDAKTQPSYQPGSDFGTTKPAYQPGVYGGTTKPSYQPGPYSGTTKLSYQPGSYNDFGTTKPTYQPNSYSGTTKPSYQSGLYNDFGTTKPAYQPSVYGGTTKLSYQPSPYSGIGTTKPSYQPGPYSDFGTTKPAYQPGVYDGTTKPSYQPNPYSGTGTTKPSYQPGPYNDFGTTKPAYQPGVYDGTTKPSYEPNPYSGTGTTKPSYQPGPYSDFRTTKPAYQPGVYGGTTKPSYEHKPYKGPDEIKPLSDCQSGSRGCENRSGCGSETKSPDSCGQPGVSVDISKISGPIVGSDAYPNDFSQSTQKITPGTSGQPFNGSPFGGGNSPYNCVNGIGCVSGPGSPSYAPGKFDKTNTIAEGGGSYPSNPFLTGKISSPEIGGPIVTSTSKPIGHGNPFLQGNVGAISGAWSQSVGGTVAHPSGGNKNVISTGEEAARPIGKDNPFLHGSGSARGDIGINDKTATESDSLIPINDRTYAESGQTSGSPVSHYPGLINDGSSLATKNPPGTNRGSGSGGGIGIGSTGFENLPGSHSFGDAIPGAFVNSQASSYANSGSYSGSGAPSFGQTNSGSWASSGANAGSWSSSSASAYASSNAGSWSGGQPSHVKG